MIMSIGKNAPVVDKLIKKTSEVLENAEIVDKKNKESNASNAVSRRAARENATSNTVKMTFYIKQELLDRLYNFSYWDRYTVTEAFNIALTDGLKDKNTKQRDR